MPNLVGLRETPPSSMEDQVKRDTLIAMQMEALGLQRRDFISTTDFKEHKFSYVSTVELAPQRLVNKSSIGEGEKSKLEGWNNAWTRLQDDATESQNLQDVNEGLGQTHRANLMKDQSVREYTGGSSFRGRDRGGRGGRGDHSGRGGGNAGRITDRGSKGKAKGERRVTFQTAPHQPVTRVRAPKGHRPATQPDVPRCQSSPISTTNPAVRPTKGNMDQPRVPVSSIQHPIVLAAPRAFMASINKHREQPRDESSIRVTPSCGNASKKESAGQDMSTSISKIKATTSSSNKKTITPVSSTSPIDNPSVETTIAASKPVISTGTRPKANMMDLDVGQESMQPVLQFTAPSMKKQPGLRVVEDSASFDQTIDALEKTGRLKATELEMLRTIQAQVHARESALSPLKVASRQAIHTRPEVGSLRPAATAPKVSTGIAGKFIEQQNAFLIGEHVHKTRYHTAASLTEDFEKLSISDKKPTKPTTTNLPSTEKPRTISDEKPAMLVTPTTSKLSTTEKSKINPFGPPPVKSKGPSLPAHLSGLTSTTDHGAAARAQYLGGNDVLAPLSNRSSLMDVTAPTRPLRRNKINETGFIALAENRVSVPVGKK